MSIKLKNVSIKYRDENLDNDQIILRDLNLLIRSGDFLSILGANGSGKTSLIYTLNGLIPHAINSNLEGQVWIDDICTYDSQISEISKKVGIVFQDPELVIFNLTVFEEVLFGVKNLGLKNPEEHAEKALETVGLYKYKDQDPSTLSDGQKQLLCIASILAMDTDYIVLDEPVSHLDYRNSQIIYELLKKLNLKEKKTIIVIEHDTDFVKKYSKNSLVLGKKTIQFFGKTSLMSQKKDLLVKFGIKPF